MRQGCWEFIAGLYADGLIGGSFRDRFLRMLPVRDCGIGQPQDSLKSDGTKKSISERAKAKDPSPESEQSELAERARALTRTRP